MAFNTAIFYDIENLLKGYSFSHQMISNLSLTTIVAEIRKTNRVSGIGVQRAYANWSDSRLNSLRGEINELGIDPIQVFGFSWDSKKNAADIQLAIDAIDLAHIRPALDTFVIVSGDGGFASLAKKLHEYGITVIGCAYRIAANRTFQAVCDEFVCIADPEGEDRHEKPGATHAAPTPLGVSDPRNVHLAGKVKKCDSSNPHEVLAKVQEVLNWYTTDPVSRTSLIREGIKLSTIGEAIKFAVLDFQAARYGFAKVSEYVQYACKGMSVCLTRAPNAQAVLTLRGALREGVEVLPDLDAQDLESAGGYRSLLATGSPSLRLPPISDLHAIVNWIAEHPPERADLGTIIELIVGGLNESVSPESAKMMTLTLLHVGAFEREPEDKPLAEQRLTLIGDVRNTSLLSALLRSAARNKLLGMSVEVKEDILAQLFGESASS